MPHIHNIYDSDTHFSINPITRKIRNESSTKISLIQHDHNSERFTFEMPRFVEGHDMSLCDKIEIHYINLSASNKNEKSEDVYLANDVQISPEDENVVIFSWLISGNATKYAGTLNFLISFKCLTGDVIDYAWHTEIFKSISIGEGMNNGEAVVAEYSDVLEAWKAEVLGGGKLYRHYISATYSDYSSALAFNIKFVHYSSSATPIAYVDDEVAKSLTQASFPDIETEDYNYNIYKLIIIYVYFEEMINAGNIYKELKATALDVESNLPRTLWLYPDNFAIVTDEVTEV